MNIGDLVFLTFMCLVTFIGLWGLVFLGEVVR